MFNALDLHLQTRSVTFPDAVQGLLVLIYSPPINEPVVAFGRLQLHLVSTFTSGHAITSLFFQVYRRRTNKHQLEVEICEQADRTDLAEDAHDGGSSCDVKVQLSTCMSWVLVPLRILNTIPLLVAEGRCQNSCFMCLC